MLAHVEAARQAPPQLQPEQQLLHAPSPHPLEVPRARQQVFPAQFIPEPQHCSGQLQLPPGLTEHAAVQTLDAQVYPQPQAAPQLAVRGWPQLSVLLREPQFLAWRAQNWGFVSGVQQAPVGPHTSAPLQEPQEGTLRGWVQLSVPLKGPQACCWRWQNSWSVSGTQLGHTPASAQVPASQVPQSGTVRGRPQLSWSDTGPQALPRRRQRSASDSGVHTQRPLTHASGGLQVPHCALRGTPQLSRPLAAPH